MPAGDGWTARIRCSTRPDGDFRCDQLAGDLRTRRTRLLSGPWTWLKQVHEATVVVVEEPGGCAGATADGAATSVPAAVLSLHTADCAPVVLIGDGAVGVAHAGWRGIVAGVLGATADAVRAAAPQASRSALRAVIGPVIRPASYEFGRADLDAVAQAAGCRVDAVTAQGSRALDVVAAVRGALHAADVDEVTDLGFDTADEQFFSHRVRAERGRGATVVRLEAR